ncbi:GlxA family transcriptional regulator [Aquicoccus porphyridii]|uniref:GlxA family transcriptional regulator n=1 Tax=Aquicoccus porphyridii TaxID=1852029 RepID=UPI00273E68DD|nr:GlxA family transcriptional regulator [Aquicoccus porphyridii]
MQTWLKPRAAMQQVDILLFDHFSALCLANTVEPMRAANNLAGRALYRWRFLTVTGASATSSSGMRVEADGALADHRGDMLIAMPSYHYAAHAVPPTLRALRAAAARYDMLAGFDTGSWLLAAAGLLDGYRATIHWEEMSRFEEAFPEVEAQRQRHVTDRNRLTCSGALAAFDLMAALIGARHGHALRLELEALFMNADTAAPRDLPQPRGKTVARAVALMQANLESPLTIEEIARQLGRSRRSLESRMSQELGAGPQAVYKRLRLIKARKLVRESDLAVAEIALRSGYHDPGAMTRAFRAEFGETPRQMRREAG